MEPHSVKLAENRRVPAEKQAQVNAMVAQIADTPASAGYHETPPDKHWGSVHIPCTFYPLPRGLSSILKQKSSSGRVFF